MSDGKNDENTLEPSAKKRIIENSLGLAEPMAIIQNAEIAAFRVQFFLNKFSMHSYKTDGLFKFENFLKHNFANLLKIDPAHIIGVKCHRNIPPNAQFQLPADTIICEVVFLNAVVDGRAMLDIVNTFKSHLQTMDFSSWKIFVGSQYVTVQNLNNQQLLLLIKSLGLTLGPGSLENIARILKMREQRFSAQKEKHQRSSRKGSKYKKKRRKHRHRSRRHRSSSSKKRKHRKYDDESSEDEDSESEQDGNDESEKDTNDENTQDDNSENEQDDDLDDDDEDESDEGDESGDDDGDDKKGKKSKKKSK